MEMLNSDCLLALDTPHTFSSTFVLNASKECLANAPRAAVPAESVRAQTVLVTQEASA